VLVSVSTEFQDDGAIIAAALEGLAEREGSVIVTTAAVDPDGFAASHDRVRIVRHLPHAAVIPEVDVVVTHGGMGTTQRSLAAGVPVCVVPWGRDQSETARRVEVAGAGTMVPRSRLDAARLRAAVDGALERTGGARRVAEGFRAAGGAGRAAAVLSGLIGEPRQRRAAS
jgi:UDP:flavonoid glycosyltransferase YjiC (YdhE family)